MLRLESFELNCKIPSQQTQRSITLIAAGVRIPIKYCRFRKCAKPGINASNAARSPYFMYEFDVEGMIPPMLQ